MATAVVPPKKNYRAALLRPAPPKPKTNIYSPPTQDLGFNPIVDDCIGKVVSTPRGSPELQVDAIRAVVEFEEEELKQYQSKKGVFHTKLQETLDWLSKKLNKNVLVFVGHSDVVEEYFQYLNYEIYHQQYVKYGRPQDLPFNPALETIVILIGCFTAMPAYRMNTHDYTQNSDPWNSPRSPYNPYYYVGEKPIYFFGFTNLMHIYQSDIYMCEEPHTGMKSMSCIYPNALKDKEELLKNNSNTTNPLRKCCQAKYDRFKSMFVEELNTRRCVKFTKENLLAKIQQTLKSDGSMDTTKITQQEFCSFKPEDGTECPSKGCYIRNPYKGAERYAESFDKAAKPILLGHELLTYADANPDEKVMGKIQSLKPEERPTLWMQNYLLPSYVLVFDLLSKQYYKTVAAIFKSTSFPLHTLGIENKNFFSFAADLTDVDDIKLFELFELLVKKRNLSRYQMGYYLRGFYDTFNKNALYYIVHSRKLLLLEYYLWYTENNALVDYSDTSENWKPILVTLAETHNFEPLMWKYLLCAGANPSATFVYPHTVSENPNVPPKGTNAFEYILEYVPPPFPREIMMLLCIFGYSDIERVEKQLENYKEMLENPGGEARQKLLLQASESIQSLNEMIDELRNKYINRGQNSLYTTDWEYPIFEYSLGNATALINNPDIYLEDTVDTLKLCLRILKTSSERKRKIRIKIKQEQSQLLNDIIRTHQKALNAKNALPILYKTLNQTLKRPNVKVRQNMKKTLRNKGVRIMKNNTQAPENRATKLQELIDMVTGKQPETVSTNNNFVGGRKRQTQTRKNYAPIRS